MLRSSRIAVLAAGLALAGCDFDGSDIVIVPEFDERFSFESGFEEWMPSGTDLFDPAVDWEVARTDEHASDGTSSVALRLDNVNGQGKVWIERRFEVAEEEDYVVEIRFDLGTSDTGDAALWSILAGAGTAPPANAAAVSPRGDTGGAEGEGVTWLEKSYQTRVTSTEDGEVWVHVGIWGTWESERTYYVDDVRVVFTRDLPAP